MALIQADRVKATGSAGSGAVTLVAASGAFRTFASVMSVGDTCYYCIVDQTGSSWEVGLGTYSGTNTLTRTTVFSSSNSNTTVTFTGTQDIFLTYPAQRAVPSARQLINTMVFNL